MAIEIIDAFTGTCKEHGKRVKNILEYYYDGKILIEDTSSCNLSFDQMYQILEDILKKAQDENLVAVNVSYGSGETDSVKFWNEKEDWYNLFKSFFENNIALCFSAGNISKWESINYNGVSILASSPYVIAVSAIDEDKGIIPSYAEYDENLIDYFTSGKALDGSIGTSFSSPQICAFYANLLENGLTIPQVDAMYRINSEPVKGEDNNWYWYLDLDKLSEDISLVDLNNSKELVFDLYYLICGRRPDPEGLDFWINIFDQTENLNKAIEAFIYEAKKNKDTDGDNVTVKSKIEAIYEFFFDRFADLNGLSYWIDKALHNDFWDNVILEIYYAGKENDEGIRFEEFFDDILACNDTAYIEPDKAYYFHDDFHDFILI